MASKTQKSGNGRTPVDKVEASTPDAALAFSQDQLQALIALSDVVFKGAEEIRRCQMQAAHQARLRHEKAQADVARAGNANELLNLQAELLRFDMESSGKYWQQLAAICAATQADAMNLLTRSAATVGGDVAKLVGQPLKLPQPGVVPASATSGEAAAAVDPSQAWNQWVDLGKQWSDMLYRTEAALH
ncbi:MAG: phasin family protein [Rhizobacter sp.]|nr:phasin family protein [Rhizobacter sp.]